MTPDLPHPYPRRSTVVVTPPRRLRVLVAEDEPVSRQWLLRTLDKLGHETLEAADGERAWELFCQRAPDVVITDWLMPGIDGRELCRRVRLDSSSPYAYIIFTTVLEDHQHILDGLAAGADDYLTKPIFAEDIEARLIVAERVTALHRAGAETLAHRDMLLQLARRFATETDPETILSDALTTAVHLLGADAAIMYRWDETDRVLVSVRSTVWDTTQSVRVEQGRGAAGRAALLGGSVVIDDYLAEDTASTLLVEAGIRVALAVPLMHEGRLLGALEIGSRTVDRPFSLADSDTLELLAGSVASAMVSLSHARALRAMAGTDPLTGLANPVKGADVLERYLKLAQRKALPVVLAMLDLANFKDINETFGRQAGDAVLQRLAGLLMRAFRGEDIVVRWEGNLFLVGMLDMQRDVAIKRLQAVQSELTQSLFASPIGKQFSVAFNAGVVRFPEGGASLIALTASAEAALQKARAAGSDRIVSDDESGLLDTERLASLRDLHVLQELAHVFMDDFPGRLEALRICVQDGDVEKILLAAHTLVGGAATLGAQRLRGVCEELERNARAGTLGGASSLVNQIDAAFVATRAALDVELAETTATEPGQAA